jgi:hypothetical protein
MIRIFQRALHAACQRTRYLSILIGSLFALKAYIMTLTPLSYDLGFAVQQAIVGRAHDAYAPYSVVLQLLYSAWSSLPIQHPALNTFWDTSSFQPSVSSYALVFLVKSPLLLLDAATGIAMYIALRRIAPNRAGLALLAWSANPYVLLINEMWAPVDLLPTFMMFVGFLLLTKNRYFSMGMVAASIALKLFPIISVPALIVANRDRGRWLASSILASLIGIVVYVEWLVNARYDPILQLSAYGIYTQPFNFGITLSTLQSISDIFGVWFGQDKVALSIVFVVIAAVFLFERWPHDATFAMDGVLFLFLVFLGTADWWPPYILWILPFATMDFASRRRSIKYLALISASAFFLALARLGYFAANSRAFLFVPADTVFLRFANAVFVEFFSSNVVRIFGVAVLKLVFAVTCFVYAGRIVEDRTSIFSSIFGHVNLFAPLNATVKTRLHRLDRLFSQRHVQGQTAPSEETKSNNQKS